MAVEDVNEADFDEKVIKSKIPVLVDNWAEWCGPCRMYSPVIDEVSKDYEGKVRFMKLNVDENQAIAAKFNIMSIPTTILFSKGQVKAMQVGAVPKEVLKRWIDKNL
ncbi:MAG: thioredoxin [Candidatus Micrarchaeales archaeon]|nr:thioredoxin [Candidatus Micrarchaeales archaeon]